MLAGFSCPFVLFAWPRCILPEGEGGARCWVWRGQKAARAGWVRLRWFAFGGSLRIGSQTGTPPHPVSVPLTTGDVLIVAPHLDHLLPGISTVTYTLTDDRNVRVFHPSQRRPPSRSGHRDLLSRRCQLVGGLQTRPVCISPNIKATRSWHYAHRVDHTLPIAQMVTSLLWDLSYVAFHARWRREGLSRKGDTRESWRLAMETHRLIFSLDENRIVTRLQFGAWWWFRQHDIFAPGFTRCRTIIQ